MTKISLIAALSDNHVIGKNNELPWHLPEDLAHFKRSTEGQCIVMGRKTWDSLWALRQKPLPKRQHIVISRQTLNLPDGVDCVLSLEAAISHAKAHYPNQHIWIIGGAQIYEQAIPLVDEMFLTWVHTHLDGDAFFPDFSHHHFKEVERQKIVSQTPPFYALSFVRYVR
jgi:dihydrofolate reductase